MLNWTSLKNITCFGDNNFKPTLQILLTILQLAVAVFLFMSCFWLKEIALKTVENIFPSTKRFS